MPPADLMRVQYFLLAQKCTCAIISRFLRNYDIIILKYILYSSQLIIDNGKPWET